MIIIRPRRGTAPLQGLVRKVPVEKALAYVREAWVAYCATYNSCDPPLREREERDLTEALGVFMRDRKLAGQQGVQGMFLPEVVTGDLHANGLPGLRAGRVDLVWFLRDVPALHMEFKIIDGTSDRYRFYLYAGLVRYCDEIYGRGMREGAMCALVLPAVADPVGPIIALIEANPGVLDCHPEGHPPVWQPSAVADGIASFDTVHRRASAGAETIRVAHVFLDVP